MPQLEGVFSRGWPGPRETTCGPGSSARAVAHLRRMLPVVTGITGPVVNDAGCGDLTWIAGSLPPGTDYRGYDVVEWPGWDGLRAAGWALEKADICSASM